MMGFCRPGKFLVMLRPVSIVFLPLIRFVVSIHYRYIADRFELKYSGWNRYGTVWSLLTFDWGLLNPSSDLLLPRAEDMYPPKPWSTYQAIAHFLGASELIQIIQTWIEVHKLFYHFRWVLGGGQYTPMGKLALEAQHTVVQIPALLTM